MAKVVGGKFRLAWDLPGDKEVVNSVLFFGAEPITDYDNPAVKVPTPKAEFNYPQDDPGLQVPSDGSQTYVAVAAEDAAGNLSDLVSITVPFDVTPPGPVTNLRQV